MNHESVSIIFTSRAPVDIIPWERVRQVWFEPDEDLGRLAFFTLVEAGFFEKVRVKDLSMAFEMVVPWDRRQDPDIYRFEGVLWVTSRIHFQDFAYLGEADCKRFQAGKVAEAILALCRKFKLPEAAAKVLMERFPLTPIPYSVLDYSPIVKSNDQSYTQIEELTDRELGHEYYDRSNWCITPPLTGKELAKINDKTLNVCVPTEALPVDTFVEVANAMVRAPRATLRVQDSYDNGYIGLGCLKYFGQVRRVCLDHVQATSLDDLRYLSPDMIRLELDFSESRSKPSLAVLNHFNCLQSLTLRGLYEDLSKFPNLRSLRALSLQDIQIKDLSSIACLENLESLAISSKKLENLSVLSKFKNLRYLCLERASKINTLEECSQLTKLEYLKLIRLNSVEELPSLENCKNLRRLHLQWLKNFSNFENFIKIPNLKELLLFNMKHVKPEHLQCLVRNPQCLEFDTDNNRLRKAMAFPGVLSGSVFKFDSVDCGKVFVR
ncbi:MAG: hypothetical protein K2Y22_06825 [Candidatus Obscuribacterales bacterium]|nr:hypothetical protein [Candidatus Obscuribacterales bacterium]